MWQLLPEVILKLCAYIYHMKLFWWGVISTYTLAYPVTASNQNIGGICIKNCISMAHIFSYPTSTNILSNYILTMIIIHLY